MGCAASKLDSSEAVQLCRDRKKFIRQAIDARNRFASDHEAYIQSLKRVSAAFIHYAEAENRNDFFFDSYVTPSSASLKKLRREISEVRLKSLKPKHKELAKGTVRVVNHLRSGGKEDHEPEDSVRIGSYNPVYGSSVNHSSLWDHLWNLFPSLDSYGYPSWTDFDSIIDDDVDSAELRLIREEEGIPELETVNGDDDKERTENEKLKAECKHAGVQVDGESYVDSTREFEKMQEIENKSESIEASGDQKSAVHLESPGYTANANRRAVSMAEVMKRMERQFLRICERANEVSAMLEASGALSSSPVSNEQTDLSARFGQASSSKENINDRCSDYLEKYYMVRPSHQATLDRLYEWEKKLYEEVKAGESVRIAYEKKCMQLKSHDINGEEPSLVEQTRVSIRDLYTHFKVYIHTVESISKRIEALRDAELCPQLVEFIKRLSRMWKIMEDGHRMQKHTINDAKLLVLSGASVNPSKPPRSAAILAAEVHNWRCSLTNWNKSMRSYAGALSNWATSCSSRELADVAKLPPAFGVCTRWSRLIDSMSEKRAAEGIEFFAAGMAAVSAEQLKVEGAGLPSKEAAAVAMKIAEIEPRVLCVGMSVAVGPMADYALRAAQGYNELVKKCQNERVSI